MGLSAPGRSRAFYAAFRKRCSEPSAGAWRRAAESNRTRAVLQTALTTRSARRRVQHPGHDPGLLRWQRSVLPLDQCCVVRVSGNDPDPAAWKTAVQPITPHSPRGLLQWPGAHVRNRTGERPIPRADAKPSHTGGLWRCSVTLRVALLARQSSSLLRPSPWHVRQDSNLVRPLCMRKYPSPAHRATCEVVVARAIREPAAASNCEVLCHLSYGSHHDRRRDSNPHHPLKRRSNSPLRTGSNALAPREPGSERGLSRLGVAAKSGLRSISHLRTED